MTTVTGSTGVRDKCLHKVVANNQLTKGRIMKTYTYKTWRSTIVAHLCEDVSATLNSVDKDLDSVLVIVPDKMTGSELKEALLHEWSWLAGVLHEDLDTSDSVHLLERIEEGYFDLVISTDAVLSKLDQTFKYVFCYLDAADEESKAARLSKVAPDGAFEI